MIDGLLFAALIVCGYYTVGIDFSRAAPRTAVFKPFGILREDVQPRAYWLVTLGLVVADLVLFLAIIWRAMNR